MFVLNSHFSVDGPPKYRLGFIGAPVATVLCYNTVALLTILGLVFQYMSSLVNAEQVVVTAPENRKRFFDDVSKLLKAGVAGVGEAPIDYRKSLVYNSNERLNRTCRFSKLVQRPGWMWVTVFHIFI